MRGSDRGGAVFLALKGQLLAMLMTLVLRRSKVSSGLEAPPVLSVSLVGFGESVDEPVFKSRSAASEVDAVSIVEVVPLDDVAAFHRSA